MIQTLSIILLLAIMEISLSFDNAVVNATVLKRMKPIWQKRFLTWGILVAVGGMRLVFPALIVAAATGTGIGEIAATAINDPDEYSKLVTAAHVQISSFGGVFLLLVFLSFAMNSEKDVHWIGMVERALSRAGRLAMAQIAIPLVILLALQTALPEADRIPSLICGVIGVITFIMIKGFSELFSEAGDTIRGGIASFCYLEILDMSFSLDGVVGAFAISKDILVIMVGLGIGAYFVRRLTIKMVRDKTLEEYRYLEHGAQYGILALSIIMLVNTVYHVPGLITGLIGVSFIGLSILSSKSYKKQNRG